MEKQRDVISTFEATVGSNFRVNQPYSQVNVLCVHWEKNDISPETEIQRLRECFEQNYAYTVTTLALPGDDTREWRLIREIVDFVGQYSKEEDSLIVLYYAGHCDANKDGFAEWAAFEEGGPTVQWHVVQQLLFAATGDVLLLLDCCFASLIKKGQKSKGRFELLAACAMNVWTPIPGPSSFTSLLVGELPEHAGKGITANELASRLREHPNITQTPVFHDFARTKVTGIKLQCLNNSQSLNFMRKPTGYVVFRASLSDDITGLQLAEWLKTAPPANVTAVRIEVIVADARRLQSLVGLVEGSQAMFVRGSIFEKLSFSARQEIVRAFRNLDTTLVASSQLATNSDLRGNSEAVRGAFEGIRSTLRATCVAVETPVLTQLGRNDLQRAYEDEVATKTGTTSAISLYDIYHDIYSSVESKEINRDLVNVPGILARLDIGTVNGSPVLVETYQYEEDPSTSRPYAETLKQVHKMTSVLCHPKASTFHILRCLGFFHNKIDHTFGVTFKAPPYFNPNKKPVTLLEMYIKESRVPLGHRICLAAELAAAVNDFHTVGWVHKGLRSENIAFLPMEAPRDLEIAQPVDISGTFVARQGAVDMAEPYLFGFEYMRMLDAGTNLDADDSLDRNLYRHPDRWGKPKLPFEKSHDVYALGVVLAEIAFWEPIHAIAKIPKKEEERNLLSPTNVLERVRKRCASHLAHRAGEMFHLTIMACLDFKSATEQMDAYEMQKYYQDTIERRLRMAVGKI